MHVAPLRVSEIEGVSTLLGKRILMFNKVTDILQESGSIFMGESNVPEHDCADEVLYKVSF